MPIYLMNDINNLAKIDFWNWGIITLAIMVGVLAGYKIISEFLGLIGKPVGWAKQRKEDHDMILRNSKSIQDLMELHQKDNKCTQEQEEKLREDLSVFMDEVRTDIKNFTQNRIHDREQSLSIQKQLSDSITELANGHKLRDEQIKSLMSANKELIGNIIDERYEKYIKLGGIPQNEVDEFDTFYDVYHNSLKGNHGRQTKYEYVKEHLPIIPVEMKLVR